MNGMRLAAIIVGIIGAIALGVAVWLLAISTAFYFSDQYAPHSSMMPLYRAGNVEADGSAIFVPALLAVFVAVYFLKFAWNLWRKS
jgi:hypothetical protein